MIVYILKGHCIKEQIYLNQTGTRCYQSAAQTIVLLSFIFVLFKNLLLFWFLKELYWGDRISAQEMKEKKKQRLKKRKPFFADIKFCTCLILFPFFKKKKIIFVCELYDCLVSILLCLVGIYRRNIIIFLSKHDLKRVSQLENYLYRNSKCFLSKREKQNKIMLFYKTLNIIYINITSNWHLSLYTKMYSVYCRIMAFSYCLPSEPIFFDTSFVKYFRIHFFLEFNLDL